MPVGRSQPHGEKKLEEGERIHHQWQMVQADFDCLVFQPLTRMRTSRGLDGWVDVAAGLIIVSFRVVMLHGSEIPGSFIPVDTRLQFSRTVWHP